MAQPHLDYRSRSASPEWHTPSSSLPTRSTWLIPSEVFSRIICGRVHRRYVLRRIAEPTTPRPATHVRGLCEHLPTVARQYQRSR
jgi:hypothetical protein